MYNLGLVNFKKNQNCLSRIDYQLLRLLFQLLFIEIIRIYLFLSDLLVCVMHFVYTLRKNCAFYADVDKTVVTDQCG